MDIADMFGVKPAAVSKMMRDIRTKITATTYADAIESVVGRIRKRLIEILESRQNDPGAQRDPKEAQSMLLQRLREVEVRLFGRRVFGSEDGTEKS